VCLHEELMNKAMKVKSDDNRKWSRTNADPLRLKQAYGDFLRTFPWQFYVTLTFSRQVSHHQADAILDRFVKDMQQRIGAPLSLAIGKEGGNYSGCGRPSVRVHFHLLLACDFPVDAQLLADVWKQPGYGGARTKGPGAMVLPYDPKLSAVDYVMKGITDPNWDWSFRNLELLRSEKPANYGTSAKVRRLWKRHQQRLLSGSRETGPVPSLPGSATAGPGQPGNRSAEARRRCRTSKPAESGAQH
jgi:hypothetical protein